MSSAVCTSNCVQDTRVPVRATYVNLYKWPESDAEFLRAAAGGGRPFQHPKVVDSISCRQLYLRSYTFSRKETVPERTKKCLDRVRERVVVLATAGSERRKIRPEGSSRGRAAARRRKRCAALRRVKELSTAAFSTVFQRLLSCTASVDVVDDDRH